MKKISILILLFCFFSLTAYADETASYNQIVIFGDSLSDNGNLYNTTLHLIPKSPPYYAGRFSNGKTWSDLADDYFKEKNDLQIANYAVGGETVVFHNPFDGFLPYTFKDSLNSYYLHTIFKDHSHTLFIIWLGANDYLNGSKDPEATTTTVVKAIQENIESLISKGAKNFIVLNLPDLALTPYALANPSTANLHLLTSLHNEKLQAVVNSLQSLHRDIIIRSLDVYGIYNDITAHTDQYNQKYHTHLKDLTTACWTGGYLLRKSQHIEDEIMHNLQKDFYQNSSLMKKQDAATINFKALAHYVANNPSLSVAYNVGQSYTAGGTACENPDDYGFWDYVHPSAAVHTIIGSILIDNVNQYYHFQS